jgi:two-component system sensor histidine kinase/response regulator
MDLQMPEMDGHQATSKIRSDRRFTALPIYAMTAHATLEERDFCLVNGMTGHIAKPIDPALLFDILSRIDRRTATVAGHGADAIAEATVAAPPDVPLVEGLNSTDGLRRVGGNTKLYVKLLHQFASQQAEVIDKIRVALTTNDIESASRAAHTLKGVAGNLGAGNLQDAAAVVEALIRNGSPADVINAALAQLATILDPMLAQLRGALAVNPTTTAANPDVVTTHTRAVAAQLTKLFVDFDTSAVTFVEENQANLRPTFDDATWEQFLRHTQEFEFADAQTLLNQVLARQPEP